VTRIDHDINIMFSSIVWSVLDTVPAHTTFQDFFFTSLILKFSQRLGWKTRHFEFTFFNP